MKQTIIIKTSQELQQFKREFVELADTVKRADGAYVTHITSSRGMATKSAFITKAQFDSALSPAMRTGSPAAFSPHLAGGKFLPHRLDAAYGAYQRAQLRADLENNRPGSALIKNRQQYLTVYGNPFNLYPPGQMGDALNASTAAALK